MGPGLIIPIVAGALCGAGLLAAAAACAVSRRARLAFVDAAAGGLDCCAWCGRGADLHASRACAGCGRDRVTVPLADDLGTCDARVRVLAARAAGPGGEAASGRRARRLLAHFFRHHAEGAALERLLGGGRVEATVEVAAAGRRDVYHLAVDVPGRRFEVSSHDRAWTGAGRCRLGNVMLGDMLLLARGGGMRPVVATEV